MPCFSPLEAYKLPGDSRVGFSAAVRRTLPPHMQLILPCGQCIGCRLERSRQAAVRCVHEASLHDDNSFVTLTYDEDHLPLDNGLDHRDFQLFMKRLRKRFGPVRFYMCGEYGEQGLRPHYHALFFGVSFPDKVLFSESQDSGRLYTSEFLSDVWGMGHVVIGDVSFESAAYVARYCVKKRTGPGAAEFYSRVDSETGECFQVRPEYCRSSLKPGIGKPWFDRYSPEVFPRDFVVINGVKATPPRYYLSKLDDDIAAAVKLRRRKSAIVNSSDSSYYRLRARADVARARNTSKGRKL